MYASIRKYKTSATSIDPVLRQVETRFSNIVSGEPGFIAYYAVDAGGGAVVTISVFETQEAADRSDKLAAQWLMQNFASAFSNKPEILSGPVRAHRLPDVME